jgi:DMSO/TMAO reductase YedYZ molybdopterin-dependent catalytic subunit
MTERHLDRRAFFRIGIAAGPVSLLAACGYQGSDPIKRRLAMISRANDWVGEHVFFSNKPAPKYPESARSTKVPAYHISKELPRLGPDEKWALSVGGEVRKPMQLTREMLEQFPRVSYTVKHHCVEGWTAIATWAGVPFSTIAELVQPTAKAKYVRFDSFDQGYFNGWDLASAMHPETILAYAMNDQPLTAEHGAPLRLYSPVKLGYKLTKYLTTVSFTSERPGGYWEDQGYPWFGGV